MLDNSVPAADELELSDSWSDEDIQDLSAFALSNADDRYEQTDR